MIMRFLFGLFLAAFVLSPIVTYAQLLTGVSQNKAGVTYTGPGDIVSGATVWFGLRAYSAAVAATGTQSAVDLRRASDSGTCTAKIATNGSIDLTVGTPCAGATVTTFCNATSCFVSKWYDQSGNLRDASQVTAANQPQLFLTGGSNNLPYTQTTSGVQVLSTSGNITPATGLSSLVTVANRASGTGASTPIRENGFQIRLVFQSAVANKIQAIGGASGTLTATANDNAWHSIAAVINGASSVVNVDGTETTGTTTGSTTAGSSGPNSGSASTTTNVSEAFFYDNVGLSSGQRTSLYNNIKAYWGTP